MFTLATTLRFAGEGEVKIIEWIHNLLDKAQRESTIVCSPAILLCSASPHPNSNTQNTYQGPLETKYEALNPKFQNLHYQCRSK